MGYNFKIISRIFAALALVGVMSFGGVMLASSGVKAEGRSDDEKIQVTAKPVAFTQPTCDKQGSYTIPVNPDYVQPDYSDIVDYKIDGKVVEAGTYNAENGSTVTVTASLDSRYESHPYILVGATEWTNTFKIAEDCTPAAAAASTPLQVTSTPVGAVNAGAGAQLAAIVGLVGSAGLVTAGAFLKKASR